MLRLTYDEAVIRGKCKCSHWGVFHSLLNSNAWIKINTELWVCEHLHACAVTFRHFRLAFTYFFLFAVFFFFFAEKAEMCTKTEDHFLTISKTSFRLTQWKASLLNLCPVIFLWTEFFYQQTQQHLETTEVRGSVNSPTATSQEVIVQRQYSTQECWCTDRTSSTHLLTHINKKRENVSNPRWTTVCEY